MIAKIRKFSATWCGPCKILSKILQELPIEVEDIDVEENDDLVEKYNINTVPTLHLLDNNDNILKTIIGSVTKTELEKIIEELS